MEFKIFRDCVAALDIATTNIEITEKDNTLTLQFECHDCTVQKVKDHAYKLDGVPTAGRHRLQGRASAAKPVMADALTEGLRFSS
jgi:hypothetical protein